MSTITIELPEQVKERLEAKWQELPRYLLEHLAVEGYRSADLSSLEVGEMLGLDYWGAHNFLVKNKVYPQYGLEELEEDRRALAALRQIPE